MACGPAGLQDLKHNPADENVEAQSTHKSCQKPVKLNLDGLLQLASAKKMAQRQLFGPGRNLMKDIQNKGAARKTLAVLPGPGLSSVRRRSGNFKGPVVKPKSMVNSSRPGVVQSQYARYGHDSNMYRRKTQLPVASGYNKNTQKISASSAKKEAVRLKNENSAVTAIPSRQVNVRRKVMGHIPHIANLENSVNLLNVDDVEEKLMNEASLLKSQLLKQFHKNTREVNACDEKNDQKILNEQNVTNEKLKLVEEKLKHVDEKLDKTLNELTNLKEIIKNLSSYQDTECKSCSCHYHTTDSAVVKSGKFTATNNLEHKVILPTSDQMSPETDNCAADSENKTYSLRRSIRLNKGAQYAYDSLRKSTKLLTTPRPGSAKKTNTPGRIKNKIIAQLNDLYPD